MSQLDTSPEKLSGPELDRRTTLALLAGAGLSGLAGCAQSGPGEGTPSPTDGDTPTEEEDTPSTEERGGRLKAGWKIDQANTLDVPFAQSGDPLALGTSLFNGPLILDKDFRLKGDLAKDWTFDDNATTLTFEFHDDVYFHDDWEGVNGNRFTAADFKYTMRRTIENDSTYKGHYTDIKPIDDGGIEVLSDTEARVNLEKPLAPMLVFMTRGFGRGCVVACKGAVEEMGSEYGLMPIGTGPFKITEHDTGNGVTLERHERYHKTDGNGNQLPYLDGMDVSFIPENQTLINALKGGDIWWIDQAPKTHVEQIRQASNLKVLAPASGSWFTAGENNIREEPLNSQKFRLGVAKLLDREAYIERAVFGFGTVAKGYIPPAQGPYYREDKPDPQAYDPEEGRQLIEDAGYGDFLDSGETAFTLNMTTSWPNGLRMGKTMKQLLGEEGLTIELNQLPPSTYWDKWGKSEFESALSSSEGDADPDQSLYNFFRHPDKGGVWNPMGYALDETADATLHADEVHDMLAQQRQVSDVQERAELIHQIEDMVTEEAIHFLTHHGVDTIAMDKRVKNYPPMPLNRRFENVWIAESD